MPNLSNFQVLQKFSIWSFIWKKKYLILFLLFTLPIIISSISQAISERNAVIPFVQLGNAIINSDHLIYKDVQILKTDSSQLLGIKPSVGIYRHFLFYIHSFFYIWRLLGYIFMIIIPFSIFYFIFNLINSSTKAKNIILSGILGLTFIFVINLLITIVSLANGSISLALEGNQFTKILQVILLTLPFHGVFSLIIYLISLFR